MAPRECSARDTLCLLKLFCRKENSSAPPLAARTP